MGGNVENNPNNKGLTPVTARVLNDTYGITKKSELKAQIKVHEQNLEDTEICENGFLAQSSATSASSIFLLHTV